MEVLCTSLYKALKIKANKTPNMMDIRYNMNISFIPVMVCLDFFYKGQEINLIVFIMR